MKTDTFHLKFVASDKVFYEGECRILVVPELNGEMAIMTRHEDMVIATREGEIRFRTAEDADWRRAAVGVGLTHVLNNEVTVLVDTAERPEDIDAVRARQALERAKEQLRQKQSIQEYRLSKASLARAFSRLKEVSKYNN
ncbi:MAG: ATP synthase F1 subunit epsilon [Clostridium sp.]|jgi:F-type H+-transporting ATPase subunit epsilon|nr:ATP synthase F1 subunit epsilon [Clostridium sp.]